MRAIIRQTRKFRRNERGSVAIIFGFTALLLAVGVGLAIDSGRTYQARSKIANALDAAALAGAKGMRIANLNNGEVKQLARKVFDENMKGSGQSYIKINSFVVDVDRSTGSVGIDVASEVPTLFGPLAGVSKFDIPVTTLAKFESKDIELSLSVDMTGSMCWPCSKIQDLQTATKDLIDIMLPDAGTTNKVRIGFAPFAAGVNAGPYAGDASGNRSRDGCVYERDAAYATSEIAPGAGSYAKVARDPGVTRRLYKCPRTAQVMPLSNDKSALKSAVDNFNASGSTAGHLGTAWAWYLLSPSWSNVWPASAKPAAYGTVNTIKAVILMTDGIYNTYGGKFSRANRTKSENDSLTLCDNIKAKEVIVYTIGFELNDPRAISVLQNCASSPQYFFNAGNGSQLRAAFRAIAVELNSLRLAR